MVDRITVADLDHGEQDALDELVTLWRTKRRRNALRAGFYDMKNATQHLMSSAAPNIVKQRSFVLGWSAIAVDKLNRRCNLEGFYDRAGRDLDSLGMSELVRENRLLQELSQAGTSSLIHAVSWIITTQGDTEAGEPEVLVTPRDALTGTGVWDTRRRALRSFLSLTDFDDDGEPVAMTMYLQPGVNVHMTKAGGRWRVERFHHAFGVPVDPLRYKPRLGRPFGSSRITRAVMSIHQQALAAMIRADVNGEAYSLPRYVLMGATESAFQNVDGTPRPAWQAAWDAVWAIGDDDEAPDNLARADVKQFHGQSPEPQNAHLRMLAQMFSGETGVPIGELGIIGDSNPTSYEAMSASRDDIISEAEQTTDGWSPDLSAAATRALLMFNGGELPEGLEILSRFRNPMHVSRSAAADAGTKVIDKIPWLADSEVGMEIMGLTPDQIRRALADKRRQGGSAALRVIQQAVETNRPVVTADANGSAGATPPA
ncbi:MAG: phage portal protein [Nocardioidaceae bacterium]